RLVSPGGIDDRDLKLTEGRNKVDRGAYALEWRSVESHRCGLIALDGNGERAGLAAVDSADAGEEIAAHLLNGGSERVARRVIGDLNGLPRKVGREDRIAQCDVQKGR